MHMLFQNGAKTTHCLLILEMLFLLLLLARERQEYYKTQYQNLIN